MTARPQTGLSFEIKSFGEDGWIAVFPQGGGGISVALFANAVAKRLRKGATVPATLTDAVAGIGSVTLRFNPAKLSSEKARSALAEAIDATSFDKKLCDKKPIEIPVCYGGEYGPDLDDLCLYLGLTMQQLIETHAARTYRVLTLGFAPGFAYLGPLDPALQAPRLDTPRHHVDAGAVGVAGPFTGVYPLASPGGWRIIGRTPACLFDPKAPSPFLFEPGAEVRFVAIEPSEFMLHQKAAP